MTQRFLTPEGRFNTAVQNFSLTVKRGEFVCLVGPTGCGKSTTLNLVTGLIRPSAGQVRVMGEPVSGIDPRVGFVFQSDALFPWRSVLDNVAAGPRYRGVDKAQAFDKARQWIARVGLGQFEGLYPHQLSGGMRRRVALAQTFVNEPEILLLDEPFGALDVQTRAVLQDELLRLWSGTRASVVFATHDLEEAVALADQVVVLTASPATVKNVHTIDLPRPRRRRCPAEARAMTATASDPGNTPVAVDYSLDAIEQRALASQRRRSSVVIALRLLSVFALIGAWELAAALGWIDPFFFGRPSGVGRQIYEWVTEGTSQGSLWVQMLVTLEETVLGFLIGSVAGIVCGIALGRNRFLADVFGVYIGIANSIPRVVFGSIFIISLGLGLASKVALAVVTVFFVVFANAFQGVREADRVMIANAQILGASQWQLTTSVVIPSATSWMLASLHVSFGFALAGAVVGEFLGSKQGIGLLISTAQGAFNANGVFAAMILLAAMALVAEHLITSIENRLVRWKPAALIRPGAQEPSSSGTVAV